MTRNGKLILLSLLTGSYKGRWIDKEIARLIKSKHILPLRNVRFGVISRTYYRLTSLGTSVAVKAAMDYQEPVKPIRYHPPETKPHHRRSKARLNYDIYGFRT